jgi:archaellum biogenesis protein FlaJ (TadC family)
MAWPMSAPIPKAAAFSVAASFLPWAVGALLSYVLIYAGGHPADAEPGDGAWEIFSADWLAASALVFPLVAAVAMGLLVYVRPARDRWMIATRNTVAYTVLLLIVSIVRFSVEDAAQPVDEAFVMLIVALFTLQIPLCFAVSAVLAKPLAIAAPPAAPQRPQADRERV